MYQQDNTPCHKAKSVTELFKQNNINVLQWPARSPDLNPIENVWTVLDRKLTKEPVASAEDLRENLKQLNIVVNFSIL
jgi:transposase